MYILNDHRNATTNQPLFSGNLVFIVSSGTPAPDYGYLNLSTIPTYALSPAWTAVAAAYRANYTGVFTPPQYLSAVVCTPNITIDPWVIEMAGSTVKLLERHSQRIGNLDPVQLQLAIQDSFGMLPEGAPILSPWGFSLGSLTTFFTCPTYPYLVCDAKPAMDIDHVINTLAIPSLIQAYLDGFPFGSFIPSRSKHLTAALVLVAQKGFLYAIIGLYALLSIFLVYIFRRIPAPALDIQRVLELTNSIHLDPRAHGLQGRAVATTIERMSHLGHDGNDAEKENRVRHVIGSSTATILEDHGDPSHQTLSLETAISAFTPDTRRERIDNARIRYAWMMTPALGAALVALGLEVNFRPHAIASAEGSRASLYASMFTWAIGIWRSMSLVGVMALLRRANSDVSTISFLVKTDSNGCG